MASSPSPLNTSAALSRLLDQLEPYPPSLEADPSERITALDQALCGIKEWLLRLVKHPNPPPETLSSLTSYFSTSFLDYVVVPGAISHVDLAAVDEVGEGAKAKIMLETVSGLLRWLAERATAVDEEGERKGWGGAVVGVLEGLMAHLESNGVGNKTPSDLAYRTLICTLLAQTLVELVIPSAKELPGSSSMELDEGVAMGAKYAALDVLGELMSKNEESKKYLRSILPADHLGALLQAGYDSHLSQLAFELAFRLLPASSRSRPTSHPKNVARTAYLAELFSKDRFAGAAQDLRDKFGEIRVQEWDEGVEKVLQVIADAHIRRSQPFRALSITYNSHELLHPSAARSSSNSPRAPSPSLSLHEGLPAGLPTLEQIAAEHFEPVKLWICRHMVGAEVPSTTERGMEIKRMVAEFEGVEKVWVEDLGRELDILSLTFLLSPSRPLTLQTHPHPSSPSRLGLSQRSISDTQLSDKRSSGNEPTRYHELKVLLEGKGNNLEVLKRTLVERSTRYPKLGEEIPDFPHRSAVLRSAAGAPPTRAPAPALQQHGKNVTFAPMPTERQQRRKSSQAEEPIVGAFGGRATPGSGPSQLASPAEADEEEQEASARSSQEAARRREEAAMLARLGSDAGSGASGRSEPEGEGVEGLGGMGEQSWSVLQAKAKTNRKAAGPHEQEHDTIESATSAIIETTTSKIGTRVLVPDSPMSPRSTTLAAAEAANSKSAPAGPSAVTSTSKTKAKATLAEPAAIASSKAKGKQPTVTSTSKATPGSPLAAPTSKATPAHPVTASTTNTKAKQPALAPGQSRGKEESTPGQRAALVEKAQGDPSSELSVLEPSPKMGKSAPTKGKGKAARSDAVVDRNVDETGPATSDAVEAEKTGEIGVRPKKVVSSNYAPRGKRPAGAKEVAQPAPVDVDEDEGAQDQQGEEEEPVSALATRRKGAKSTKVKSAGPSKGKKVAPPAIVVNAKAKKRARRTSASDEESQLSDEEPDADAGGESDLPDPKDVASAKKQRTTAPVKKVVEPFKSKLKAKSSKRRKVSPPSDADDDQLSQHTDYDYPGKVGSTLEEKRVVGMSAKTYGKDKKKAGRPKVVGTTKKAGGRGKRKLEEETGGDSEPSAPAKKKPARSTRAAAAAAKKKVAKQAAESEAFEFESEEQEQEQEEKEEKPMKKTAKGKEVALKKGKGKKAQAEEDEDGGSPEKSPPLPPAKKYKDMRVSDDIPLPFDLTKTKRSSKQRAPASIADDASSRKSKAIRSFSQLVREPSKDVAPEAAQDEIFQPVVEGDDYQEYFEHDNHAADVAAAAAAALKADRMDVDRQPTPLKIKQQQQQQHLAPEPAGTGSGRSISPMLDPAKDISFVERAIGLQPSAQPVRSALEAASKVLVEYNPAASVRAQEHAKVNTYLGEHMISSQKAPASVSDQGDVDMVGAEEYVEQESDMGEAETDGFYSAPGAADDSGVHFQVPMDEGTQGDDEDETVGGCDEAAAQQEQVSDSLPVRLPATSRSRAIRSQPVPVQQQHAPFPAAAPVPSTSKHALPQPVRPTRTLQQGPSKPGPSAASSTQAPADGARAAAAPPGVLLSRPSVSAFAAHPPPTDPKSGYKGGGKQVQLDVPPTPQRKDHQTSDFDEDFTSDDLETYNCFEDFARVMAHKNRQRRCERQVHHELSMRKFDQALNKYLTATLNQTADLVNSAQAFVDERLNPEKGQVTMKLDASAQRVRAVNRKLWEEAETELAAIEKEEAEDGARARAKGKQKERA